MKADKDDNMSCYRDEKLDCKIYTIITLKWVWYLVGVVGIWACMVCCPYIGFKGVGSYDSISWLDL